MTDRRILREPLLHFLLIGLALFALHGLVSRGGGGDRRIVVDRSKVDELAAQFENTWSRLPNDDELGGLIDSYVHDEILYREGVALGLDRDDPVIKRRVRQKLDVLAEEESGSVEPTDAQLSAYIAGNPRRFSRPGAVTFDQVHFDESLQGPELDRALATARRALDAGGDPATLSRSFVLPAHAEQLPLDLVARDFGAEFAAQLNSLPLGTWAGPIRSGFGMHLVRVSARAPAELPTLVTIRPLAIREWEQARRESSLAGNYRRLLGGYDVRIEGRPGAARRSGS